MDSTVIDTVDITAQPASPDVAVGPSVTCPHCHKGFHASVDAAQPLRLQGSKCPHCKLFVPARLIAG